MPSENNMGGRHFTLGADLRVQSSQAHGSTPSANNSNLRNLANAKHVATYQQPVQGPLTLDTYKQMARDVHATRPGMSTNKNTVGIFHQNALSPAQHTGSGNKSLDTRHATVMTSNTSNNTVTHNASTRMTFGPHSQKNHFTGNHN